MATFGERLKELRVSRSLSMQALADKVGISKSSIAMYERGDREPNFEMQEILADFFNGDMDYLFGRSDRTTIVVPSVNGNPKRRYLMDRIAKADDTKLRQIEKMLELLDGDNTAE